ncbi:cell shape determination protein CcmA [Spirosoma taeanense]|uniref:Cell shape determination protein CcmA n=1 Tax=Spirosoma taeanense TaxID=2735870 RepID=A0A6M5Y5N4_9BACT|nr:IPT/TIG domain-containing protein [Spirosoma taeanense]QJW88716.1 cell shape determination protein CcmA [Spirosoma taeanense]
MKSVLPLFSFLFLLFGLSTCRVRTSPPDLTEISPAQSFVGQEVTLSGYQFGQEPIVTFGESGTALTATVVSSTEQQIRVVVPRIRPGITQVRVRTSQGISDPLPFIVQQPVPAVSSVSPANGLPGSTVVLTGDYLNQLTFVRFADADAVVQDSSAEKLTVVVPPNVQRGPVALVVETKGGQLTSSFIVAGTPQITSVSPKQVKPGSELVIQGNNLLDGVVRINGMATDRSQTSIKNTEIRTIVPTFATSGRVTVTVFEKLVATSADSVQIVLQPSVASLSARDGVTGDKIILAGLNLRDISGVRFGSTPVSFRVLNDTQLEATVPALTASGQVTVSVTGPGGSASATDPFFFYLPPSNLTVNPARQFRDRPITITGQNLYRITEVRVSGQPVPITERTEGSQLIVSVPVNAVSGIVSVTSRAGTATTSRPLVVIQPATVTDIVPRKARPGERVVLLGDQLLNAQIFFTGSANPAPDGGKNEDTERWVLVPADAQTGPIRVFNASGENTYTAAFTVIRLATITDFTPKTGKAGTEVTITGQNLSNVSEVRFNGGTSAPATFRLSGNSLIVTVPANVSTGQICLTNDAGTACTSANFTLAK